MVTHNIFVFVISMVLCYTASRIISAKSTKRGGNNMLQWLVNLVSPIFEGMGVSPVDVQTYAEMLSGYIYGILAVILAVIVMMFVAHVFKKGTRHVVR